MKRMAMLLLAGMASVSHVHAATPLFAADLSSALDSKGDTGIVRINVPMIRRDSEELTFDLLGQTNLVADRTSAEVHDDGTLVWHGHVRGHDPWSDVQLVRHGDKVVGKFHVDDTTYLLRPAANGRHELRSRPDDDGDMVTAMTVTRVSSAPSRKPGAPLHNKDALGRDLIALHVAYSAQAWQALKAPRQETLAMVDEINTGLARSGATFRLTLAGVQHTSLGEFDRLRDALAMWTQAARPFEEVRLQREAVKGDLVAFVVAQGDSCGVANHHVERAQRGFSVVRLDCARHRLALAQAVGHNLGASTDPSHGRNPVQADGHAFALPGVMRTVMANDCGHRHCPQQNVWSNPQLAWEDDRRGTTYLGVEGVSDNVRVMNERAPLVAGFR